MARPAIGDVSRKGVEGAAHRIDERAIGPAHGLRDRVEGSKEHARAIHEEPLRQGRNMVRRVEGPAVCPASSNGLARRTAPPPLPAYHRPPHPLSPTPHPLARRPPPDAPRPPRPPPGPRCR